MTVLRAPQLVPARDDDRRGDSPPVDRQAIEHATGLLRELAAHHAHQSPALGDVEFRLATLLEASGRGYAELPADVANAAMEVVAAVGRATGNR